MTRTKKSLSVLFLVIIFCVSITTVAAAASGTLGSGGSYSCSTSTSSAKTTVTPNAGYAATASIKTTFVFRNPNDYSDIRNGTVSNSAGNSPGNSASASVSASTAKTNYSIPSNFTCIQAGSNHSGKVNNTSDTFTFNINTSS